MKRFALIAFAACLATAAAHAQSPAAALQATPAPEAPASAAEATLPAANTASTPEATESTRLSDAHCVRQTGSRIIQRDGKPRCTGQPGRAYTKDDIDRTGHLNLADALRTLDPAFH